MMRNNWQSTEVDGVIPSPVCGFWVSVCFAFLITIVLVLTDVGRQNRSDPLNRFFRRPISLAMEFASGDPMKP